MHSGESFRKLSRKITKFVSVLERSKSKNRSLQNSEFVSKIFARYSTKGQSDLLDSDQIKVLIQDFCEHVGVSLRDSDKEIICQGLLARRNELYGSSLSEVNTAYITSSDFVSVLNAQSLSDEDFRSIPSLNQKAQDVQTGFYSLSIVSLWDVLPLLLITTAILAFSGLISYIIIAHSVAMPTWWSVSPVGISFAVSGAGLSLGSLFFCLIFINNVFLQHCWQKMTQRIYILTHWVEIHVFAAYILFIGAMIHGIAWLIVYSKMTDVPEEDLDEIPTFGAPSNTMGALCSTYVSITGFVMAGLLVCQGFCSSKLVRPMFNLLPNVISDKIDIYNFQQGSHRLISVAFVVLLLLHPLPGLPSLSPGPQGSIAWIFLALPILLFMVQIIIAIYSYSTGGARVKEAVLHPNDVIQLICTVPRNRKSLQPGQAMYLLIPIISKMEWHPFSISKCVGEDNIQFHIKTLGNWTGRLHQLTVENRMRDQRIFIVGPITTTVAKYKRFDKVIFIGSGIGVTPFISILSGMMSDSMTKLKIYHLHWLVPSQDAAKEWFRDIFQDIERCESHHAIKVTIWFTRGRRASNLAEMHALQLFQSIYTTSTGKDLFSGLSIAHNRIKVRCGKPSWEKEFNAISEDFGIAECNQSRPIGVFCCAHQSIRKDLIRVQRKHFTDGPFQMHFEKFNHWS